MEGGVGAGGTEKATRGDAEVRMSDGEEDKEEDMRDEEEVSDSEEGDEKKRRSREVERRLIPAGPPGIKRLTSVQKSSSDKTDDSSHGRSRQINQRLFNRKENKKKVCNRSPSGTDQKTSHLHGK